jgi:hypothetical protein
MLDRCWLSLSAFVRCHKWPPADASEESWANGDPAPLAASRRAASNVVLSATMKRTVRLSNLRGSSRLAVEATIGLTDLVETVHRSVTRFPRAGPAAPGRTRGIAGFVYRTVRRITGWAGGGLDAALTRLAPVVERPEVGEAPASSPKREVALAVLNGVVGDHLEASGNPLAIPMEFRRDGRALDPAQERGARILLLVHGLCRSDEHWRRRGHDHGARLAADLGFTPVYLRYNSGRAIDTNGRELALRLEELLRAWPEPVTEVAVVAHSLGGLVVRRACEVADAAGCDSFGWRERLRKIVFLGTPHHGAPLERGGNWLQLALGLTSYTAAFARLGRMRSAAITDLRHGQLAALPGEDRFARGSGRALPPPLPRGVACFAAAASRAPGPGRSARAAVRSLIGDGLVPVASALGDHPDPARALSIPPARRWIGYGMNHLDLLDHPAVYGRIREWLTPPGTTSTQDR